VADFEPHVPEAIENALGDRLAPSGLLVGEQKQQIDVGARREQAAAVTAGRHHRHALRIRRRGRAIEPHREVVENTDDLILHGAKPLRAGAAMPVGKERFFRRLAALRQHGLKALRHRGAQLPLAPGMLFGERGKLGRERLGLDQHGWLVGGREHAKAAYLSGLKESLGACRPATAGRMLPTAAEWKWNIIFFPSRNQSCFNLG
jgi:hypothetical protein